MSLTPRRRPQGPRGVDGSRRRGLGLSLSSDRREGRDEVPRSRLLGVGATGTGSVGSEVRLESGGLGPGRGFPVQSLV